MILKDKVALVTGGSAGIGKAIVIALAEEGCNVIFTYNTNKKASKKLLDKIHALGVSGLCIKAEMRSQADIMNLFSNIEHEYKKIDILINNVGINRPFDLFNSNTWRDIFEVNLFSVIACTEKAIKLMGKNGRILNISSVYADGKACWQGIPAYGASKAAINHFTQTLAKNMAPDILVNAIAPGYVKTPLWVDATKELFTQKGNEQLIERMINPNEIADIAIAVIKNDAMTGEIVVVDGGLRLKTV